MNVLLGLSGENHDFVEKTLVPNFTYQESCSSSRTDEVEITNYNSSFKSNHHTPVYVRNRVSNPETSATEYLLQKIKQLESDLTAANLEISK